MAQTELIADGKRHGLAITDYVPLSTIKAGQLLELLVVPSEPTSSHARGFRVADLARASPR